MLRSERLIDRVAHVVLASLGTLAVAAQEASETGPAPQESPETLAGEGPDAPAAAGAVEEALPGEEDAPQELSPEQIVLLTINRKRPARSDPFHFFEELDQLITKQKPIERYVLIPKPKSRMEFAGAGAKSLPTIEGVFVSNTPGSPSYAILGGDMYPEQVQVKDTNLVVLRIEGEKIMFFDQEAGEPISVPVEAELSLPAKEGEEPAFEILQPGELQKRQQAEGIAPSK